ncbi:hydrolase [Streptomyces lydicus]|nr:hydrolase [Streptomyces lydicus]
MTGVPSLAGCLHSIGAVVFDTDGVITDSARVHAAAWKDAFDPALAAAGGQRPFDPVQDYLRHVDGRARLDGAAAFLASRAWTCRRARKVTRRARTPCTPSRPGRTSCSPRVWRPAASRSGPAPSDCCGCCGGSGAARRRVGVRHATALLDAAGCCRCWTRWWTATRRAGCGCPASRTRRSSRSGPPARGPSRDTAVVEDALAGVEAGRRGGFGLVVGVDRTAGRAAAAALRRRGADLVVADPGELLTAGED